MWAISSDYEQENVDYVMYLIFYVVVDFEAQIRDLQQKRKNVGVNDGPAENRVGLGQEGHYDSDIYEGSAGTSRFEGYLDSIPATDDQEVSCCDAFLCFFVSMPHSHITNNVAV